ncbi:motilin-like isoform X1 [Oreochromis aureus]|uniref:motilin-like isoform X1 n=1 Tax=Oreochromis aureus TaxID=47969 RepID=UPI001953E346|nr:motilin-like isoform X1 [Oreochromis aureus]
MSMRGAVAGCVVLVCLMALLVQRTEGHITFFSPKELMLMKEREGRKDMEPRSEDGQFEEVTVQQVPQTERGGNPEKIVENSVRLSPKQLDHVTPVLEEIIHEITQECQKAK